MVGKYDRAELKDLKLIKENEKYYFDATYEYENKNGVYELNIPRIILPIVPDRMPSYHHDVSLGNIHPGTLEVDLGYLGYLQVERDMKTNMTHRITEIKKKPRKMTLAEVEKRLGHKIELVSE